MPNNRLHIVMLTPGFVRGEEDSVTMPSLQLYFKNLKALYPHTEFTIISFFFPFRKNITYWNGIPVHCMGGKSGILNKIFVLLGILRLLFVLRRNGRIDLVHAFWMTDTALAGMIFRMLTRTPLLITAMGQDVKPGNKFLPFLLKKDQQVVFLSEFQKKVNPKLNKLLRKRIIPFGTDPSFFSEEKKEKSIDIIGVGSLNKIKNYDDFVEVIRKAALDIPEIRCRIIGEGAERTRLSEKIRSEGLENNIILCGELSYSQTICEMQKAKVLLHTSIYEGQGLVITEALHAGAFVVSYPTGIASEAISQKVITGNTTDELAASILLILKKENIFFQEKVISIEETCHAYNYLYKTIVSGCKI